MDPYDAMIQQCLLFDKVDKRAYLKPNFSIFLAFGTNNLV